MFNAQCFPLYYYEPNDLEERGLFETESDEAFIRRDGVSDFILRQARERPDKILYNDAITVGPVPAEAYDYVVNGKSAIEWVMERYAVTTHKESGIVNDQNLWCDEHDDPVYIVNLLRRVIDLATTSSF